MSNLKGVECMTKILFQIPTITKEVSDEAKHNASFAMLGVVAIIGISALVFLFQHVMVTPGFGESSAFVVYQADKLCQDPGLIVSDKTVADLLHEQQGYRCQHTRQNVWCCYPKHT